MFALDNRLAADTLLVGRFDLSLLLLHRDANYPWFILVPARSGITEIFQLAADEQQQLMRESSRLSVALVEVFKPDKINVAALGNVVPQLHVHHIARFKTDAAWPGPVWGAVPAKSYEAGALEAAAARVAGALLGEGFKPVPAPQK